VINPFDKLYTKLKPAPGELVLKFVKRLTGPFFFLKFSAFKKLMGSPLSPNASVHSRQ
jgi:hypothetical protein